MKNYLYSELYEFFKGCENKKDRDGKHYITLHYIIERPYLPMETRYTLGINDMLCYLLGQKQPENVVIELKYSPKWIDPLHPTCVAKETENMLMTNFNTRDNMQEDKKIKYFCEKIPKTYDTVDPFFARRDDHICWFANDLKEPDNNVVASLDSYKLFRALCAELAVLRYLMRKHKNSRARVFYDIVFVPTLDKFIEECGYKNGNVADNRADASDKKTQGVKEFVDGIGKGENSELNKCLASRIYQQTTGHRCCINVALALKKGSEILKYVIDSHRHQRGINFTEAYQHVLTEAYMNSGLNRHSRGRSVSPEESQNSHTNVAQTNKSYDNRITNLRDSHGSPLLAGNSGI